MIKLGNLSASLKMWLMSTLGMGPGIGDLFYVVGNGSNHHVWLANQRIPGDHIFTSVPSAEDAMTANRNDVLLVFPGDFALTTMLTWDKDNTHLVGVDMNVEGDYTQGGCNIYTTTASVAHALDIKGDHCKFVNLKISNGGANAANLGAALVEGYGNYFKNVNFMGILAAEQIASANPYSLGIGWGGYFPIFEDCIIGQCTWGPRTQTASGHLKFTGGGVGAYPPDGGIFRRCRFLSWAETVTIAEVYLAAAGNQKLDRMWLFDQSVFYNFYVNSATGMNQVFDDNEARSHHIVLKGCTGVGYDEWQDADSALKWITADMPITGLGGGLCRPPTAITGS